MKTTEDRISQNIQAQRAIVIVLDSCGIGALPDAARYGDEGSNTIANTAATVGGLSLPHLQRLGLGNIAPIAGVPPAGQPTGAYGKMAERSEGKDSTNGHWEIMGVVLEQMFPVYPEGFPDDLMLEFESRIGRKTLGNKPASGTVIIEELGAEHLRTGYPIIYTSADSVFQIAAHESIIPVDELYRLCEIARALLHGEHAVGRVIARPFVGEVGALQRTARRKDFSLKPPAPTVLDFAQEAGLDVLGVGKVDYLFANQGITDCVHVKDNDEGISQTIETIKSLDRGIVLTNLGDFDTVFGHRNNPQGFAAALEAFDHRLPEIQAAMQPDDVLFITADHGCDPTTASTDHSREYVPLLVGGAAVKGGVNLGARATFADLGATVASLLRLVQPTTGESFAHEIAS
jgi:phosphopentomutase